MKEKVIIKRIFFVIAAFFLSLYVCFQSLYVNAFADDPPISYDETNVMDDLKGMTIDGETFDITNYAFDETRDVQIISFVEYCYSYSTDKQSNYGLYIYIWNPKGLSFVDDSTRNRLEFIYGESNDIPEKYPLTILNKSEESGYEGLFYKLKVALTDEQKTYILATLNSVSRTYHISGIELLQNGETTAKEYTVATTFTYSGFSAGYGSDDSVESTLTCTRNGNEVLELKVYPTYYRPNGSNGVNSYTQDTLMSVYFSIPNNVLASYDRLSGLECSWIKVMTDWAFVTGNTKIYNAFMPYIGKTQLYEDNGTPNYALDDIPLEYGFVGQSVEGDYIVGYNSGSLSVKETVGQLDYCFFSKDTIDSTDNYILSGNEIYEWIKTYYDKYVTEDSENQKYLQVDGNDYPPYSENLFDVKEATTTKVLVSADDERSLINETVTQNWWQKIWGGASVEYSETFDGIEAIHEVTAEDMQYSSDIICDNLYISPQDISDFESFYKTETLKDRTVFLLRYDIGTYQALEAAEGTIEDSGFVIGVDGDTNARVFRQDVYLNFDIIYAEFERSGEKVIIPVVSNPIDIVSDSTPALNTRSDRDFWDLLKIILGIICLIFICVLLQPILNFIITIVFEIVKFPFKLIGKLFKNKKK